MILPYIPASNLFFPVGFVIAERVLYMPSMGLCLLTAYGFNLLARKLNGKLCWFFMAILMGAYAVKTYQRNWDWTSEYSIFMSGLQVNQRNAKLYNNVGHALEGENRYEEALTYFLTAVNVQPDDVGAHINVGRTYTNLEMYGEAEEAYLRAKSFLPKAKPGESYQTRIPPNYLNVFLNLANLIAKNRTRLEEADNLYRQAISMRSDYIQAYLNRADVLIKMNRSKEAQQVYERALLYDSSNPDIYYNVSGGFGSVIFNNYITRCLYHSSTTARRRPTGTGYGVPGNGMLRQSTRFESGTRASPVELRHIAAGDWAAGAPLQSSRKFNGPAGQEWLVSPIFRMVFVLD